MRLWRHSYSAKDLRHGVRIAGAPRSTASGRMPQPAAHWRHRENGAGVNECVLCEGELGPDGEPYCDDCFTIVVRYRANSFDGRGTYTDFLHRASRPYVTDY